MTPAGGWAWLAVPFGAVAGIFCVRVSAAYVQALASARVVDGALMARAFRQASASLCGRAVPVFRHSGGARVSASAPARAVPGALCALMGAAASLPFALHPGVPAAALAFACLALLLLGLIDARCRLLPDALTLPLLWAGLLLAAAGAGVHLHDAVIGAACGYLLLFATDLPFRCVRRRPGVGGGDMKLAAALGAWLGWQPLPFVLLAACLAGILFAFALWGGRAWAARVALGPFLAGAGACGLVGWPVVQLAFCPGFALCTRWVLPAG